ncbi:MAG TPA: tripartite tricarboxylate transporter substrate binding protein [Burkholderiales bacterium]|nr:tripartite tricarboxylate transporter substrate binding protein [Burkholderiales bacterium]
MTRIAAGMLLLAIGITWGAAIQAQNYPSRPIRLIVPFEPGGTSDLLGRLVGARLKDALGQSVIIDNRGGAGGTLGANLAAHALPDGYTLLVTHVGLAINETLYSKLGYNAARDLAPITRIGDTPNAVVVTAALPAQTLQDLVAMGRKTPGKLDYGSAGVGSAGHLAVALLEHVSGARYSHIPFKGGGPSMIATVGGQVHFAIPAFPTAVPHIKTGKIRMLAVTGTRRAPTMPEVPTVAEAGVPGSEFTIWFAAYAPSGTPKAIISRLNQAIVKSLETPEMREQLAKSGVDPESSTPEELAGYLRSEIAKWAKVIKASGIPIN